MDEHIGGHMSMYMAKRPKYIRSWRKRRALSTLLDHWGELEGSRKVREGEGEEGMLVESGERRRNA